MFEGGGELTGVNGSGHVVGNFCRCVVRRDRDKKRSISRGID